MNSLINQVLHYRRRGFDVTSNLFDRFSILIRFNFLFTYLFTFRGVNKSGYHSAQLNWN